MICIKRKIALALCFITLFSSVFSLFSCSNEQMITADAQVKYLTAEEYLSGDYEGKLRDSIQVANGEKGYAVFDLTLSEMKNISEKAKGTVTMEITSSGGEDFSYKVEEFPTDDVTDKNNTVTSVIRIRSGEEKERKFRFIISLSKVTSGAVNVRFIFVANSQTTAVNGVKGRMGKRISGSVTVGNYVGESLNLEFQKSADGSYYSVVGLGTEKKDVIKIPEKHEELPVKEIAPNTFNGVGYLKEIILSPQIEKIGSGAFNGCTSLRKIVIPSSVSVIGENAFDGCESVSYYCEAAEKPSGWSADAILEGAHVSWKYSRFFEFQLAESGDGYILNSGKGATGDVVIPDKYLGLPVIEVGYQAFMDSTGLNGITIPDSVIGVGTGAFYNTGIYNNKANWENGVLYIGNHLIKVDSASGAFTVKEGTKSISGSSFKKLTSLTSVTLPDSVTSIGNYAFAECTALEEIEIQEGVKYIGDCAFKECEKLTSITVPNSVTNLGVQVFAKCIGLEEATIGDGVTIITSHMFMNCDSVRTIRLGSGVEKIEKLSFPCISLEYLYIPYEDGKNWYRTMSSKYEGGEKEISATWPESAAELFMFRFQNYYWYKK